MKKISNSLLIIFLLLAIVGIVIAKNIFFPSYVRANDNLRINFHVASPLFKILNMKPGDEVTRRVDIQNRNKDKVVIYTKAVKKSGGSGNIKVENVLGMSILNNNISVYGQGSPTGSKTVSDFFNDSSSGIVLGTVNPRQSKNYNIKVKFLYSAGNEYQSKSVKFDLIFGVKNVKFPKHKKECEGNRWKDYRDLGFRSRNECERFCDH